MAHLKTTSDVMDKLGGIKAVAEMTGRGYTAAHNWKVFKVFPANTYPLLQRMLRKKGHTAPDSLWNVTSAKGNGA